MPDWPVDPHGWEHCNHEPDLDELGPVCVAPHHAADPRYAGVYASPSVNDGIHWNGEHWHLECALDEAIQRLAALPETP